MIRMMNASILAIVCSMLQVIPPLTPEQRGQFEGVLDRKAEIDSAFYSLLENASLWLPEEEPTGAGLNVAATMASPAEYRGLPMVIEGEYLGLHEVHMVKKSGPWDGKLEQWGIRIPSADATVMVFLTNPPPVPVAGQKVRMSGRFYKIWPVTDEGSGRRLEYLVFVGNSAKVSAGLSLPPLTEGDRRGLASVVDFTEEIDRGPFYQLINNAVRWKDVPMPAAPLITHADPIIGAPAEYRGLPLRTEGILVRRQEFKASRAGAWKRIEQWVVEISPKTKEQPAQSVITYLVDPPEAPKVGDKVRVVGRFYKVWRTYLAKGEINEPYNFVVLVGQGAQPIDSLLVTAPTTATGSATGTPVTGTIVRMVAMVVLILGVAFYSVRRYVKSAGGTGPGGAGLKAILEKRRQEREARANEPAGKHDWVDPDAPPLPADPAEALLEMERRRATDA